MSKTPQRKLDANRRYRFRNRDAVLYHKRNARLRRFGLEPEDLTRMLKEQNHQCLLCARTLARDGRNSNSAHLDHCHGCGQVRGLLCKRCNTLVGFLELPRTLVEKALLHVHHHEQALSGFPTEPF